MAKDERIIANDAEQSEGMSEAEIDNNLLGTFPASDPPSWTLGIDHHQETETERDDSSDSNEGA